MKRVKHIVGSATYNHDTGANKNVSAKSAQDLEHRIDRTMGQKVPGMQYYTSAQNSQAMNNAQSYRGSRSVGTSSDNVPYNQPTAINENLNSPSNPNSPDNPNNPNNFQNITRRRRHHKWELAIGVVTCLATIIGVGVNWATSSNKKPNNNHTEKVYPAKQTTKTRAKPAPKPKVRTKVKKVYVKPRVKKIIKKVPPKSVSSAQPSSAVRRPASSATSNVASAKSHAASVGDAMRTKAQQIGNRLKGYEQRPGSSNQQH